MQNIATIAATQNSSSLACFSRLLYSALNAIQPANYVTSADRKRASHLAFQEGARRTVIVGDGTVKGWNQQQLYIVG